MPSNQHSRGALPKRKRRSHHFLAAALRSPRSIGSVIPSSRALARAMASQVDWRRGGLVVELGAGTGVVTHALLEAGATPAKLLVIERDENLHRLMTHHFPQLTVLQADAIELEQTLMQARGAKAQAVVSSLPLLAMPHDIRKAITAQMVKALDKDGLIVQFTYGPKSPISAEMQRKYHLHGHRARLVFINLPPAHVWVYKKVVI